MDRKKHHLVFLGGLLFLGTLTLPGATKHSLAVQFVNNYRIRGLYNLIYYNLIYYRKLTSCRLLIKTEYLQIMITLIDNTNKSEYQARYALKAIRNK